jgi:hypothetical protein
MTQPDPALAGPYDAGSGRCAYGHKVNPYGRCEPLNEDPPNCPGPGEEIWDPEADPEGRD